MVKIERTPTPPASLAIEKEKQSGSYRNDDVVEQLVLDFHGKCYLCEMDTLQSIEIDHLRPHHNGRDRDRMFDWNNLFYSCAHCNSVKNRKKYESNVIDCCVKDPEGIIQQEFLDQRVRVTPLSSTEEAITTASLVEDCFEMRNTAIRKQECQTKVRGLQRTMTIFYKELEKHRAASSTKSIRTLRAMLNRNYKFSGFTSTYLRLHKDIYPDVYFLLDD